MLDANDDSVKVLLVGGIEGLGEVALLRHEIHELLLPTHSICHLTLSQNGHD